MNSASTGVQLWKISRPHRNSLTRFSPRDSFKFSSASTPGACGFPFASSTSASIATCRFRQDWANRTLSCFGCSLQAIERAWYVARVSAEWDGRAGGERQRTGHARSLKRVAALPVHADSRQSPRANTQTPTAAFPVHTHSLEINTHSSSAVDTVSTSAEVKHSSPGASGPDHFVRMMVMIVGWRSFSGERRNISP